jgi:hypothetical protein
MCLDQETKPVVAMTGQGTTVVGVLTRADLTKLDVTYASSGFGVIVERGKGNPAGIEQTRAAIRAHQPHAETIAPRTVLFFVMFSNPCISWYRCRLALTDSEENTGSSELARRDFVLIHHSTHSVDQTFMP